MFGWLRNIFRKKEKASEGASPQAAAPPEVKEQVAEREVEEEETPRQKMQKMAAREKELAGDPDRPEKVCQKCGAPNDRFVGVCWMCKERV